MKLDLAQIKEMSERTGHCDHCGRVIKIYKYTANKQLALILRRMRDQFDYSGVNAINFDKIRLPYSVLTQRTKARLHGLIAHVKDDEGNNIQNTWLITTKGFKWLNGDPIPKQVVVFDNQVIGHDGGTITIKEATGEVEIESQKVSTAEASLLHDVRRPQYAKMVVAKYVGRPGLGTPIKGGLHNLEISELGFNRPVEVKLIDDTLEDGGKLFTYATVAKFVENWAVVAEQ